MSRELAEFGLPLEYGDVLQSEWERFVSGVPIEQPQVRDSVWKSWQRCRDRKLDPAAPPNAGTLPQSDIATLATTDPLHPVACTSLARALPALSIPPKSLLVIANTDLRIIHITGEEASAAFAQEASLVPGTSLTEETLGTNVFALAKQEEGPAFTYRREHYYSALQGWQSCAVPIVSPDSGAAQGFISLCSLETFAWKAGYAVLHHLSGLISLVAQASEGKTRNLLLQRHNAMAITYPNDAIATIDSNGNLQAFSAAFVAFISPLLPDQLLGRPLSVAGFKIPSLAAQGSLNQGHTEQDIEVTAYRKNTPYLISAFPVFNPETQGVTGHVLLFHAPQARRSNRTQKQPTPYRGRNVENVKSNSPHYTFDDLMGQDPVFCRALEEAQIAAKYDDCTILLGESGTGKELFAQSIHNASTRCNGPFVAVSCCSISEDLIAPELFGYTEGSFTGALRDGKPGKLELAHKGTIFLDEVGEMPIRMQQALLRAIEEREVFPVGATRAHPIDVRIIAATNADLPEKIRQGTFRLDLFHRLNVFPISLPPLRERPSDIPLLVRYILDRFKCPLDVTQESMELLSSYPWPGNLRELRNVLRRATRTVTNGTLTPAGLPAEIARESTPKVHLGQVRKKSERDSICQILSQHAGNVSQAACSLGVSRVTLYRKIKELEISVSDYRRQK